MPGSTATKQTASRASSSKRGAGASPLFPPEHTDEHEARQALLDVVRRDPVALGYERSRWTLGLLRQEMPSLTLSSDSGMHRLLRRLGIVLKRARDYIRSPDPDYQAKKHYVSACLAEARAAPERVAFCYQDEVSYYRQPSLAQAYAERGPGGHRQARAQRSHRSNTCARVVGALDALTGEVHFLQRSKIGVSALITFYEQLYERVSARCPTIERIYLAEDNWPVHFHPKVLSHLEPQQWPWPYYLPPDWQAMEVPERVADPLPIQVVCFPTYASWLNPIEKLWRWLRQEVLHLHRYSDAWGELKQRVAAFLDRFSEGSRALLRYVGLLPD